MTSRPGSVTVVPVGFEHPDPPNESIARMLKLAQAGRLPDARSELSRMEETTQFDPAWFPYATAVLAYAEDNFVSARESAHKCSVQAMERGLSDPIRPELVRLAASALELEGCALRRCEHYDRAEKTHRLAYLLRRDLGAPVERMESATSLGICREWAGDVASAERWFRLAAAIGPADSRTNCRKAWSLFRLSILLARASRYDDSITAARSAQAVLTQSLPGELPGIAAGLYVAQALSRRAETLVDHSEAGRLLRDADDLLRGTQNELLAFGEAAEKELRWCDEQLDFVSRLQESLI